MRTHIRHLAVALGCALFSAACSAPPGASLVPDPVPSELPPEIVPSSPLPSPAGPPAVGLYYADKGVATAGAHVLVYDLSGTLVGRGLTDAAGYSPLTPIEHAIVTIADPRSGAVTTIVDADADEDIVIGRATADVVPTRLADHIALVPPTAYPGANRYRLVTSRIDRSQETLPASLPLALTELGVSGLGRFDVMLIAEDAAGQPLAFSALRDVRPVTEMALGAWRTDFAVFAMDAVNIPPMTTPSFAVHTLSISDGGEAVYGSPMAVAADRTSRSFRYVPGAETVVNELEITAANGSGKVGISTVTPPQTNAASIDAQVLPAFIVSVALTLTAGAPSVAITPTPRADVTDAVVARLTWSRGQWTLIGPTSRSGSPLVAPALPADLADLAPDTDASVSAALTIGYMGAGYAPIRQEPQREIERLMVGATRFDRSGSVRYARY